MERKFAVIGLGHFGEHLAVELAQKGAEVLAIDEELERLEAIKDKVTHAVRLDATKRIIVRATTSIHERILNHVGIKEVVLPASEAADRLANTLMFEKVVDSFALTSDYTIAEVTAPDSFIGRTIQELDLRKRFEISLITIKRTESKSQLLGFKKREVVTIIGVPTQLTMVRQGDVLVVFGHKKSIQMMLEA